MDHTNPVVHKMAAVAPVLNEDGTPTIDSTIAPEYEWEQTRDVVEMCVRLPDGVRAANLLCTITATHVLVGIKTCRTDKIPSTVLISGWTFDRVKACDSEWHVADGMLCITLPKCEVGSMWAGVFRDQLDADRAALRRDHVSMCEDRELETAGDAVTALQAGLRAGVRDYMMSHDPDPRRPITTPGEAERRELILGQLTASNPCFDHSTPLETDGQADPRAMLQMLARRCDP